MIVISGALVAVALVLLVIGLTSPALGFVYASIAVSALACVFLVIGVLQRRGEDEPAEVPGGDDLSAPVPAAAGDVGPALTTVAAGRSSVLDPEPSADLEDSWPLRGEVLIVAGRPRYHVAGCRYLTGKSPDSVAVEHALDEGFSACGVCKPDEALAADDAVPEEVPATVEPTPEVVVEQLPVPARKTAKKAPTVKAVPTKAPAVKAVPAKAPAAKAPTVKAVPTKAPAAKASPAKASPAKASPAAKAAAVPTRRGTVVVIPDRGRYHRAECRYVRGAADAQELTKAQATRQGFEACGVCAP